MSLIETQSIVRTGVQPTMVAAGAESDHVPAHGTTFVLARNNGASPIVVSPQPTYSDRLGNPSLPTTVSVAAGAERWVGPFPAAFYADSDGLMEVLWSDAAGVQVGALTVGDWVPMLLDWLFAESGDFVATEGGDLLIMDVV